jgi:chloramphenicol-sensitive protein RarD
MGVLAAVAAFALWGLLPVFWKALQSVPALEILCHRAVWSLVFVALLLGSRRRPRWLRLALADRATLITFTLTATLLSANWLIYIWAVNAGRIVEASLGYYINPLVNVALGVVFLRERLRRWQAVAIAIALAAVLYLTASAGSLPWISLSLAGTFGCYGLLRKRASLAAVEGFALESALMFAPAVAFLIYLELAGRATFAHAGSWTSLLLALAGVVTALPLLWFAFAAHRVTLTTLGVIQYVTPTLQLLLGVLVYGEALTTGRLLTFVAIWLALAIYTVESVVYARRPAIGEHRTDTCLPDRP